MLSPSDFECRVPRRARRCRRGARVPCRLPSGWLRVLSAATAVSSFCAPARAGDTELSAASARERGHVALHDHERDVPRTQLQPVKSTQRLPGAPLSRGIQLDVGLAAGSAAGSAARETSSMTPMARLIVANVLVLGYRVQHFFLGASVLGGIGTPTSDAGFELCAEAGAHCASSLFRYGLQARFYVRPGMRVDPWLGVGVGREVFSVQVVTAERDESLFATGRERLNVRLGVDLGTHHSAMRASVFVDYALGEFSRIAVADREVSIAGESRAAHHWILVGGGLSWLP